MKYDKAQAEEFAAVGRLAQAYARDTKTEGGRRAYDEAIFALCEAAMNNGRPLILVSSSPSSAARQAEPAPKTPADYLEEIAGIYRERKPLYGDNYKHVGSLLRGLFPQGLQIAPDDEASLNRLHLIFHMISKLTRYAQNLQRGGHRDSLDDLAVYAMLARECDEEAASSKRTEGPRVLYAEGKS